MMRHLVNIWNWPGRGTHTTVWVLALGAKLGANRCGSVWTAVDARGIESPPFSPVWTAVDTHGRRLEIYGSEGWGFDFSRACDVGGDPEVAV